MSRAGVCRVKLVSHNLRALVSSGNVWEKYCTGVFTKGERAAGCFWLVQTPALHVRCWRSGYVEAAEAQFEFRHKHHFACHQHAAVPT